MNPLQDGPSLSYTDHLGRSVQIVAEPQRIVSLCPSQTATLFHLGLGPRVVGRTHFCIHPQPEVEQAVRVGGTKQLKFERVRELSPDLVIAEKEENTREMVEALAQDYPVYVTDVRDLPSALQMVRDLGQITGKPAEGTTLAKAIETAMNTVAPLSPSPSCAYLIWRKPWMAAGADTFIHAMLQRCGFLNLAAELPGRYPEFELEWLAEARPEVVLLSSEPFPFAEKHLAEVRAVLPESKVMLVDGEMFSWYGSHMLTAPAYLNALLPKLGNLG